jgi:hypothetical protein
MKCHNEPQARNAIITKIRLQPVSQNLVAATEHRTTYDLSYRMRYLERTTAVFSNVHLCHLLLTFHFNKPTVKSEIMTGIFGTSERGPHARRGEGERGRVTDSTVAYLRTHNTWSY